MISNHGFDSIHIPKEVLLLPSGLVALALMDRFIDPLPRLWITLVLQLPVTVEDVIPAPV